MSVEQYLARYAEPEASLAERIDGVRELAIVLPVLGESADALDGLRNATRELAGHSMRTPAPPTAGRVLVILVVNASPGVEDSLRATNAALLEELANRDSTEVGPGAFLVNDDDFELLVIDRSSPGRELPPRQGVGLARKIGCDLALALFARGRLSSPWIFWTDADATLPRDYFLGAFRALSEPLFQSAVGLCFPFRHLPSGDADVTHATRVHEICLRYHVLGLASAGSPYAHHSLGSALAVDARAYALVRGVPKRQAGEDFYLLDKLAKVGDIGRPSGEAIGIRSRLSSRVPFGTGPRVERLLSDGDALVARPAAFRTLGALLGGLDRVALERRAEALELPLVELSAPERAAARQVLDALGVSQALRVALETSGGDLRRRLHTWFDALRTLQALHLARDAGLSDVPYGTALAETLGPEFNVEDEDGVERVLETLRGRERELPSVLGPAHRA